MWSPPVARKEIAVPISPSSRTLHHSRPLTQIEALMEAMPHSTPDESVEELAEFREAVIECLEQLSEQDKYVIEALTFEQASLSQLAARLGVTKTHTWRLRNQAHDRLARIMLTNPIIRRRIKVADTWEQAAGQWVTSFASSTTQGGIDIVLLSELRDNAAKYARMYKEVPVTFWERVAINAISELRTRDAWDSAQMTNTLARKQHDYGHGNINTFGEFGVLVRLSDKIERYKNLETQDKTAVNEAVEDTLVDMVGYAVIAMMLKDETFQLNLGPEWSNQ